MTPLEELQAAHKRLSELRDKVNARQIGEHWGNIDEDPAVRADVFCAHGIVAETVSNEHADLIVTLHRTIDAQLEMLKDGMNEYGLLGAIFGRGDEPAAAERTLRLARAINES